MDPIAIISVVGAILLLVIFIPILITAFLRDVPAGTIRIVTWWGGGTRIYRGPGKSYEVPLLTNGTTISSKAINVDLDITDQTADLHEGRPRPIKVRILASAIVSVGDTDPMVRTAANRFFAKPEDEQTSTLTDLLSSSGRRAINLLTHDQLFSAKTAPEPLSVPASGDSGRLDGPRAARVAEDDDDPLAIIIRKACSRELTDLGLGFNSLNIKVVQSEVAEARRRQSAAEAAAQAEIVAAQQARLAREAQLQAEKEISNKTRELEETRRANDVLIAQAEVRKQNALAGQRESELKATQIAEAAANAEALRIAAEAQAKAEAVRITEVANANAQAVEKLLTALRSEGSEAYLRFRQIEMLPDLAPRIADALAQARLVTVHAGAGDGGAPGATAGDIAAVIRTVLAAKIVTGDGEVFGPGRNGARTASGGTGRPA